MAFVLIKHLEIAYVLRVAFRQTLEEPAEVSQELLYHSFFVSTLVVDRFHFQFRTGTHDQRQRIGSPLDCPGSANAHSFAEVLNRAFYWIVLKHIKSIEERLASRHFAPTLHFHQWAVFVLPHLHLLLLQLPLPLSYLHLLLYFHSHRQRVDEQPYHLLHPLQLRRPPRYRPPIHHLLLPAVPAHQHRPRSSYHRIHRHSLFSRPLLYPPRLFLAQLHPLFS